MLHAANAVKRFAFQMLAAKLDFGVVRRGLVRTGWALGPFPVRLSPAVTTSHETELMDLEFAGTVIEWRGPSPYYFVAVPADDAADINEVAAMATYGWGVIPVEARIGDITFETSLFPKDGGYLLPLKDAVRKPQGISAGDEVSVEMTIRFRQ